MIKQLDPLSEPQRLALIDCFKNNSMLKEYPGRAFALDLGPALEIVKPIIDGVLDADTWEVAGGNFFETSTGYRVHADTGKEGPDRVLQTFVFPLSMELDPTKQFQPEKNRLVILHQVWKGDAAFFLRGSPDEPNEYNIVVKDYTDVIGIVPDAKDPILYDLCPHLNLENFLGLTVDKTFQWTPGVPMTFPRNRLHLSTAFPRRGIKKKLGLSIFTSRKP
jgi:hypothetical protein